MIDLVASQCMVIVGEEKDWIFFLFWGLLALI